MLHKFVEFMPSEIEEGILYISIEYDVAKHKCPCGCGAEIVTTLSPARWRLTYDGETVSLSPSIGNWTHKCRSHYFITRDKIVWAEDFRDSKIKRIIDSDKKDLDTHVNKDSYSRNGGIICWIKKLLKKES